MWNRRAEIEMSLKMQVKHLQQQVEAFRSGEKYQRMEADYRKLEASDARKIKALEKELGHARAEVVSTRERWMRVNEDCVDAWEKERKRMEQKLARKDQEIAALKKQLAEARAEKTEQKRELYAVETELEEAKDTIKKLQAQICRDYETSSRPSSQSPDHKKIQNSREKTGRKPGGQPGHAGHGRPKQEPTRVIPLPPPREVQEHPDGYRKEKTISKQIVELEILLHVTEYRADVYYDRATGERIHADFPAGVVNDVNYGGSVKAFAFLLNTCCHVSIDKCRSFLSDLTGGKLRLSKGMVNGLCKTFAAKTEPERKAAYASLLQSPVMHADATNARYNGIHANIYVCAAPDGTVLYFAKEKKGHAGIEGTPVEHFQGVLVHDHDTTYYSYGNAHQECLAHVLRYLKDSMVNESERTWNKKMHHLLQEAIHYRNSVGPGQKPSPCKVKELEAGYRKLLEEARREYEYEPPTWYKDGYNLYRRLAADPASYLLFLHDPAVPATNNLAERLLRDCKRKQKQAVTFRSFESIDALCSSKSVLVMMQKNQERNLFEQVAEKLR